MCKWSIKAVNSQFLTNLSNYCTKLSIDRDHRVIRLIKEYWTVVILVFNIHFDYYMCNVWWIPKVLNLDD